MDNDLYNDLTEAYWDNDVRPFYGDHERPVGTRLPSRQRATGQRAGTVEQHRQWRIEDGICPVGSCRTDLEQPHTDEAACPQCGWSLVEERMQVRLATVEDKPDYMPRLPELFDEYSPAQVDEAA